MQPRSTVPVFLTGLIGLGAVGLLDWGITSEISVSTFYLLPVAFVAWFGGRTAGFTLSFVAAMVWFWAEYFGRAPYSSGAAAFWQSISRLVFFVVIAFFVDRIRLLAVNLEALVKERTTALEQEIVRRQELEREALEITEREQERVAHELHDQLAAYLAGIAFRAKIMAESLDRRSVPEAMDAHNLTKLANNATNQVRNLARLLAPPEGGIGDLTAALARLGAEAETAFGITCPVEVPKELPRLTEGQSGQLCRIAQEATRNAIQHSRAELVQISVSLEQERLKLRVECDGKVWKPSDQPTAGLGLRIMSHRAARLGGTLSIQSRESGGTLVTCEVPIGVLPVQNNRSEQEAASV
jgi:signal transduction histidine kinase